jgi:hypothetical protein
MNAAYPTARAAHSLLELADCPLYVFPSCLMLLNKGNPANPLIAREWCQAVPFCKRAWIGSERPSQIRWHVVDCTCCDCRVHRPILAKFHRRYPRPSESRHRLDTWLFGESHDLVARRAGIGMDADQVISLVGGRGLAGKYVPTHKAPIGKAICAEGHDRKAAARLGGPGAPSIRLTASR